MESADLVQVNDSRVNPDDRVYENLVSDRWISEDRIRIPEMRRIETDFVTLWRRSSWLVNS